MLCSLVPDKHNILFEGPRNYLMNTFYFYFYFSAVNKMFFIILKMNVVNMFM